jgi:hypothetical protein
MSYQESTALHSGYGYLIALNLKLGDIRTFKKLFDMTWMSSAYIPAEVFFKGFIYM